MKETQNCKQHRFPVFHQTKKNTKFYDPHNQFLHCERKRGSRKILIKKNNVSPKYEISPLLDAISKNYLLS